MLCSPIARAEPVGAVEHFPTKCGVGTLAAGADGNVWFSCSRERSGAKGRAMIGRITPQGKVTEFSAGIPGGAGIRDLVAGADGSLWFTLSGAAYPPSKSRPSAIGRITTSGVVTLFRTGLRKRSAPGEIVAGSDGNLWFTDDAYSQPPELGRVTPEGAITEFPTGLKPPLGLGGLAIGADGNAWFTQVFDLPHGNGEPGGLIGRLSPSGAVAQFGAAPAALGAPVAGPDGNVWFVGDDGHVTIDRVTPNGEITQFRAGIESEPLALLAGPDGRVWFAGGGEEIERITPPSAPVNTFTFGPATANANGAAELDVEVPGPGRVELHPLALVLPGKRTMRLPSAATAGATAASCGSAQLRLRLRGAAKTRLRHHGSVEIKLRATFTPSGGSANTEVRTVVLRKQRQRH